MVRTRFPRTFELIDLIEDRDDPNAYFREFEVRVQIHENLERAWLAREREFSALLPEAWSKLKASARPYLLKSPNERRGWTQLINALNEARGYLYLKSKGYHALEFIPRATKDRIETPDLKGQRADRTTILCEVKTLNVSEEEAAARREITSRSTDIKLPSGFFRKLGSTLEKAFSQLNSYEPNGKSERVAFVIPNFDDFLGEYKSGYYAQIDDFLSGIDYRGCHVAVFNSHTAFHVAIEMKNAEAINE